MSKVSFTSAGSTHLFVLLAVASVSTAPLELHLRLSDAHGLEKIQLNFVKGNAKKVAGNASTLPMSSFTWNGDTSHSVPHTDFGTSDLTRPYHPQQHQQIHPQGVHTASNHYGGGVPSSESSGYFTPARNDLHRPHNPQQHQLINPHPQGVHMPPYYNVGGFPSPVSSGHISRPAESAEAENPFRGHGGFQHRAPPTSSGGGHIEVTGKGGPGAFGGGFSESGFFAMGRRV